LPGLSPVCPPAGWEVTENFHRSELTVLERDGLVAE